MQSKFFIIDFFIFIFLRNWFLDSLAKLSIFFFALSLPILIFLNLLKALDNFWFFFFLLFLINRKKRLNASTLKSELVVERNENLHLYVRQTGSSILFLSSYILFCCLFFGLFIGSTQQNYNVRESTRPRDSKKLFSFALAFEFSFRIKMALNFPAPRTKIEKR